jgi:hypothetical protein
MFPDVSDDGMQLTLITRKNAIGSTNSKTRLRLWSRPRYSQPELDKGCPKRVLGTLSRWSRYWPFSGAVKTNVVFPSGGLRETADNKMFPGGVLNPRAPNSIVLSHLKNSVIWQISRVRSVAALAYVGAVLSNFDTQCNLLGQLGVFYRESSSKNGQDGRSASLPQQVTKVLGRIEAGETTHGICKEHSLS